MAVVRLVAACTQELLIEPDLSANLALIDFLETHRSQYGPASSPAAGAAGAEWMQGARGPSLHLQPASQPRPQRGAA